MQLAIASKLMLHLTLVDKKFSVQSGFLINYFQ